MLKARAKCKVELKKHIPHRIEVVLKTLHLFVFYQPFGPLVTLPTVF